MKTLCTLELTASERCTLESWANTSPVDKATTRRTLRAAIVLAAASGLTADAIATEFLVRLSTVYKWHQRFVQERIDGLADKPRKGAPRRISDERVADVVRKTLEPTPRVARRWSRRMMSDATGLSRSTIDRIWNRYGIAPARSTLPNPIVEQR